MYVPSLYRDPRRADTGFLVVDEPLPGEQRPLPVARAIVDNLSKFPFPDDGPVGRPRSHLRSHVDRDRARLHRGVPLLPGGDDLPPRARARSRRNRRHGRQRGQEGGLRRGLAHVALDGRLLVHLAAHQEGRRRSSRPRTCRSASRRCAPTGSTKTSSTTSARVRATGLTFAPEAGTQRMRDVVNKNVTEEQLMETARARLLARLVEDEALLHDRPPHRGRRRRARHRRQPGLARSAWGASCKRNARRRSRSASRRHVPKPHTPFQWCAMDAPADLVESSAFCRPMRARRASTSRPTTPTRASSKAFSRAAIASLADVIEHAWRNGARFDSWEEHLKLDVWREAFEAFGIDTSIFSAPSRSPLACLGTTSTWGSTRAFSPRSIASP